MLPTRLFPLSDGGQSPNVRHLLVAVDLLHQLVVELMRNFLVLPCPDDELGRVGEVSAGNVRWRVGFLPSDNVQYFVA